ncbi:MAG TPA: maleylpyruvate isomerase family mycothiol-dependent enzyme [Acidimicrobiales bacterium]|nr:maleylpyruvate isomerase family mycothiol-dependent enzyme [Acidimicrobiales bacterium]
MSADLSIDLHTARETITSAGTALTAAGRDAPNAVVTWCPNWTVSSVLAHVGCVHGWVAGMVRTASAESHPFPPSPEFTGAALADWADERRHELLGALSEADPDQSMWAFGFQLPTRFWTRRQAHETAVHAVDATAAADAPWQIPGDVADDGLAEFLTVFLPFQWQRRPPTWGEGRSIHFHRTDGDGERVLTIASPPEVLAGHGKGDLAVRGSGHDLLLWTLNRPTSVELIGDEGLAVAWAEHVRF